MKPNSKDICHFLKITLETEAEYLMRLCAFLLVEAIVFINFIVFKDQLTAVNEYLYTPCMCRSSILK